MSVDEQAQVEVSKAEQFISEIPMFPGVESVRVEVGDDSAGDQAMWLVFRLQPEVHVDPEWAGQFSKYAAAIQTKILHSGLSRFPYTRLERAA